MRKMLILLLLFFTIFQNTFAQTIHITTKLDKPLEGKPMWILIIRNLETGRVLPYLYDIRKANNYWIALTGGYTYQITASNLIYGPLAKIQNFCHLQSGILKGKSMWISITGNLSPNPKSFKCHVVQYNEQ